MSGKVTFVSLGILNPDETEAFDAYVGAAPALLVAAGGQVRSRMRVVESLVGDEPPQTVFMMDFDSADTVKAALDSPEYRALIPHRQKAFAKLTFCLAEDA